MREYKTLEIYYGNCDRLGIVDCRSIDGKRNSDENDERRIRTERTSAHFRTENEQFGAKR